MLAETIEAINYFGAKTMERSFMGISVESGVKTCTDGLWESYR